MDTTAVRINEPLAILAGKYAERFQQKVLNKGDILQVLDQYTEGDYYKSELVVYFKTASDGMRYPDFELEFEFYWQESERGYWGIVPTLGVEAFDASFTDLERRLIEAIHLDFVRKRRLASVQNIVSAIWFEAIELQRENVFFRIPSPADLVNKTLENEQKLLPRVAQQLRIRQRQVYGKQEDFNALVRAVKSQYGRNVLLVGKSGVGKTALFWELAYQQKKLKIDGVIWETNASTMIKELSRETGWEEQLAKLCEELVKGNDFLFIRNLLELFEVGQYEGNSISMGNY